MLKRQDINIRDPYVMVWNGKYYLYGTRSATTWEPAGGLDVYVSTDLEFFEGPIEILPRKNCNYWAPECYEVDGRFYLIVTIVAQDEKKGIFAFAADEPTGPFTLHSERYTPSNWTSIDGTLWFENGEPYLIYSHSFEDILDPSMKAAANADGDYCLQKLTKDLRAAETEPVTLFKAKDFAWAKPVPFAKAEFGVEEDVFFSDGPAVVQMEDGKLYMINSSWSVAGYAVGVACSQSGIMGPWILQEKPLFPENGGHGMLFRDLEGEMTFALHYPNDKFAERPVFYRVEQKDGILKMR